MLINKITKTILGTVLTSLLLTTSIEQVEAAPKEFYDSISNAKTVQIINFHRIDNDLDEYPDLKNITMTNKQFEDVLKTIKSEGYTTISEKEYIEFYKGFGRVPVKSVLLTIDDGFEDVYKNAYPLLKKYKMKAVIFPITSDVDKGSRFNAKMMTYEQMKEMVASGYIEIGNHTDDLHFRGNGYTQGYEAMIYNKDKNESFIKDRYSYIKEDALKAENKLLKNTNVKVKSISFPYGAYDETALKVFKNLDYQVGYTTKPGLNLFGDGADNPLESNRSGANYKTTPESIKNMLINSQKNALKIHNENKDIQTKTSNYNPSEGMNISVKSIYDDKNKKNTIKNYRFEIYSLKNNQRTFLGNSQLQKYNKGSYSDITFYENFNESIYKKTNATTFSMKVIMTRQDGSREIEWINYNVKK